MYPGTSPRPARRDADEPSNLSAEAAEFGLDVRLPTGSTARRRLMRQGDGRQRAARFIGGDVGPTAYHRDTVSSRTPRELRAADDRSSSPAWSDMRRALLQGLEGQAAAEAAHEVFAKERVKVPLYMTVVFTDLAPGQTEHRTFFGDNVEEMLDGKHDELAQQRFDGLLSLGATMVGANCSVGRIRRARSRRIGRVISQTPRAGAVKRLGFPVRFVVGRR